jgi:hypothetical protein
MSVEIFLTLLAISTVCGILAVFVVKDEKNVVLAAILGALLGPLGVLIAAVMR